ncbi:MAG TPA: hypothetical protein VFG04_17305 [Planctomycetaceae bacterium]|nr:hypothetical protein [Planctomycetaceae bacterium]
MRNRSIQVLRTAVLAVACSAMLASPAWAGSGCGQKQCKCYCQGVDRSGCLTNTGGKSCVLCCVINTKTCTFTATCHSYVRNNCRKSQCFKDVCFWQDPSYCCKTSVYSCESSGCCRYTASGCCQSTPEAS